MVQQKRFRKNVSLTDAQIKGLYELSEFDGRDPVEHAMIAIDEYLRKQNLDFTPPKEKDISGEIKELAADTKITGAFWLTGKVDKFEFSALFLKLPSKAAIDKGRILKLSIWDPATMERTKSLVESCIINYDRGWDIRPSKIAEPYYRKVITLLTKSADLFILGKAAKSHQTIA